MLAKRNSFLREKHVHISGLLNGRSQKKNESSLRLVENIHRLSSHHATGRLTISPDVPDIGEPK